MIIEMSQWKKWRRPEADEMTAQDRHAFLDSNIPQALAVLRRHDKPVAIAGDLRHEYVKGLSRAGGATVDEIDATIAKHRREDTIPTITVPMTWEEAEQFMPLTAPTGAKTIARIRELCDMSGGKAVVAVMGTANSYVVVGGQLADDLANSAKP